MEGREISGVNQQEDAERSEKQRQQQETNHTPDTHNDPNFATFIWGGTKVTVNQDLSSAPFLPSTHLKHELEIQTKKSHITSYSRLSPVIVTSSPANDVPHHDAM